MLFQCGLFSLYYRSLFKYIVHFISAVYFLFTLVFCWIVLRILCFVSLLSLIFFLNLDYLVHFVLYMSTLTFFLFQFEVSCAFCAISVRFIFSLILFLLKYLVHCVLCLYSRLFSFEFEVSSAFFAICNPSRFIFYLLSFSVEISYALLCVICLMTIVHILATMLFCCRMHWSSQYSSQLTMLNFCQIVLIFNLRSR